MSSAVTQDITIPYVAPYSYVEYVPYIPDPSYSAILRQRQATQIYSLPNEQNSASSVIARELRQFDNSAKVSIIKRAQSSLHSDIVDLDPDIRKLVNDNIKSLIWK